MVPLLLLLSSIPIPVVDMFRSEIVKFSQLFKITGQYSIFANNKFETSKLEQLSSIAREISVRSST